MSTREPTNPDDWLTIAEIADELHLNPATIRLWVSKGALPAKRAGMRKLLVRRSDLEWMLRERDALNVRRQVEALESHKAQPPELGVMGRVATDSAGDRPADHDKVMFALKALSAADADLAAARAASENAPPDAGFAYRVRELAHGFMEQSDALARAANVDGVSWNPVPRPQRQEPISHELRPGGNRPGPPHLWEAFDRAVDELAVARAGSDMRTLAVQTHALAMRLHNIADALGENAVERGG
jgi:excisionase family DNA binding protein